MVNEARRHRLRSEGSRPAARRTSESDRRYSTRASVHRARAGTQSATTMAAQRMGSWTDPHVSTWFIIGGAIFQIRYDYLSDEIDIEVARRRTEQNSLVNYNQFARNEVILYTYSVIFFFFIIENTAYFCTCFSTFRNHIWFYFCLRISLSILVYLFIEQIKLFLSLKNL